MENLKAGTPVTQGAVFGFGPYILDSSARRLTRGGEAINLAPKSYDVLVLLVTNAGRALGREEILETVWPDTIVEAGNLDWHVSNLRKALAESRGAIETVRGYGYRFTSDVRRNPSPEVPEPPTSPFPPPRPIEVAPEKAPVAAPPAIAAVPAARSSRRWWGLLATLAVVAALAWLSARKGARVRVARAPTVAVLGFENLSGDAQSAWLATALRELLAAELSQSANVTMIPGQTVAGALADLKLKGGTPGGETLARIRQVLGTDVVVSGSYVVVGREQKLRIIAALQDCVSGQTLATVEQNGTVEEMLAAVSAVGARLRSPFETREPSLEARQDGASFTASAEVMRLYMEGLGRLRELRTLEAKDLLARAVELDPSFAMARSALADAWAELGWEKRAAEEAKLAVERSSGLSREERLLIEGRSDELAHRWDRAAEVYQALVTFFPESVDDGLKLASAQTRGGHAKEALRTLDRLRHLPEPKGSDPRIDLERGWAARWVGDFAAMDAAGREAERKGRERALPHLIAQGLFVRAWAGLTLFRSEDTEAATREGAALAREIGDLGLAANHLSARGYALSQLGRFDEARAAFIEGIDVARRIGSMERIRSLLSGLSQLELQTGRLPEAERAAREGVEICRSTGDAEGEVSALLDVSRVDRARGELASARALAEEGLEKSRAVGLDSRIANAQLELGEALLLAGELPAARQSLAECLRLRAHAAGDRVGFARVRLAAAALAAGAVDEAAEGARTALAEATPNGGVAPGAHLVLAEALAARGDRAAGEELASAERLLARFPAPVNRLELLLVRGRTLTRLGSAREAREAFDAAERLAGANGFVTSALEARLRRARLDAKAGAPGAASRAGALEAEARRRGYGLLTLPGA